jgi:Uma2 family endonuclease
MSLSPPSPKLKLPPRSFIHYPDSDGEPMAENDWQYFCITNTRFMLGQHFKDQSNVYVGADLLVYYVEGDPTKSVAPDILVAFDVPKRSRRSFLIWKEGKAPDVIFEIASEGTWRDDVEWKRGLYLGIGVREYILFDPTGSYFDPPLQGYQLSGLSAAPVPYLPHERGERGIYSPLLKLEIWARPTGDEEAPLALSLYNPATHSWYRTPDETAAEVARLQSELAQLRGEQPK